MLSLPPRRSGPPRQPVCDGPYCLRLHGCRLGLRGYHFRGHLCVRLRYGLETRPHPMDEAVERLQKVGFPSPCSPSYRALALPLVGFPPTEHASLRWTHVGSRAGAPAVGGGFPVPLFRLRNGFTI